ncbi:MAG TPA: serine/threonine-protein kinase [Kofleriaceae bacterium]|jgi:serine/threonine protein kinase
MGRDDEADGAAQAETLVSPSQPSSADRSSRPALGGLAPGASIGRYRLEKRLGAGAMGVVWSAMDPQLDRMVAIKVVHPNFARSPEAASRLMREARAMAKVKHRAVVTIHDAGDEGDHLFIAMELIEGTDLGTILRARSLADLADWQRWLGLMLDAGRGLVAAHRVGILHRDFKPDNVLVDADGRVCVGDFGLATLGEESIAALTAKWETARTQEMNAISGLQLTSTGALVGTPVYMSPQQLRSQTVDARADQFAFCVATWEALYGARPFSTEKAGFEGIAELVDAIEQQSLPPMPKDSAVPSEVRTLLARGLAANPDTRWPDMTSLLDELERITRPRLPSAASIDVTAGIVRATRHGRIAIYVAIGVALAGSGVALYLGLRRAPTTPPAVAPPGEVVAKRLFTVPLRSRLTFSPDGRYLVLSNDRVQVRDTTSNQMWTTLLPLDEMSQLMNREVSHLDLDGDTVTFGFRGANDLWQWNFRTEGNPAITRHLAGSWMGALTKGDLLLDGRVFSLVDTSGHVVHTWSEPHKTDEVVVSPDRHRFAFVEDHRFASRIWIGDDRTGRLVSTDSIPAVTMVAFVTNELLMYATGTAELPHLWRAQITEKGVGPPTQIYSLDYGWFGPTRAFGRRVYSLLLQPTPRATLVTRTNGQSSSGPFESASVALGWTGDDELLLWNRATQRVERRSPSKTIALTNITLDGEPANATIADGVLIAEIRRLAGREAVATSLADGRVLWRHQDGRTLAVRCAGDQHAPCYAIRAAPAESGDDHDELVSLDPATGELGTQILTRDEMEDVAVSNDGKDIRVVKKPQSIDQLDTTGKLLSTVSLSIGGLRSIAFDPRGGLLVGGTRLRNSFVVLHVSSDGQEIETIANSHDDLFSLVRPSPTGDYVIALSRLFSPELWQYDFPRPLAAD